MTEGEWIRGWIGRMDKGVEKINVLRILLH